METEDAVELQNKLEMLNSMLDQDRAEQARRQQQYYIQCECECRLIPQSTLDETQRSSVDAYERNR